MTMVNDRDVQGWDSNKLGARLVELHDLADEALLEAGRLETEAKAFKCKADRYKREAAEIMRFRCPRFDLQQSR